MAQRFGLVAAHGKPEAQELAEEIEQWLAAHACDVVGESELAETWMGRDVIIAIGGDGLIMRVAHSYPGIPILGINVGRVGFLALAERENWQRALQDLVEGRYTVQEGPTLAVQLERHGQTLVDSWAINDVVVRAGYQLIEVELYVDGQFVNTYPGDGMIVATPQGSTAYCMAAGGPVLTAGVRGFAVTPICPHSPIRIALVVPEHATIEQVYLSDREARLIIDGEAVSALERGDLVRITRGVQTFRLVVLPGTNFYEAFRSKFNFQIRPEAQPSRGNDRATPSSAR
ncbi:NAD(+)/NADH kinase [Thermomicrobium sp. 4228-Ro]|uniref:NAD(+)/NADH kinase n=1 Tax=Thermomicrobium sp. 4228-Ro TaxID=2993937 RepID=UPI0022495BE1|nr:NAD(+)/NADH kinase [Thermomicrobium sp. 4228-Ro]MCX2727332.1 NAD(+)/NADH kinase [Thermomicrobium sp. 4228-Ro]